MAVRRPLVIVNGRMRELATSDQIPGSAGVIVSDTPPPTPSEGTGWFDTTSGIQYTRVLGVWVAL